MIKQASDCILLDRVKTEPIPCCMPMSQFYCFTAFQDSHNLQETRAQAGSLLSRKTVPWAQLKQLYQQLQAVQPDEPSLQLRTVCKGSQLVLQPPQARQKSPELQARLAKLQAALDQQHYDRMVHDVTGKVGCTSACKAPLSCI